MPLIESRGLRLYFEEYGEGYPLLLLAPGGMYSSIEQWRHGPSGGAPFDPIKEFSRDFRVIAMDQRNAGKSVASILPTDGWADYLKDQLHLLEHLGISECHVIGACIGASYGLSLCQALGGRITAAVLQNPIGLWRNRRVFNDMFDEWACELKSRPNQTTLASVREHMFGGTFVFSVSRRYVSRCQTPLLVLGGDDDFHPRRIATDLADLAPQAELVVDWNSPDHLSKTIERVRRFLKRHAPKRR